MSNAAKHRKKAAEFEQLKQIDRAIASYVRAIEESEAEGEDVDVALLNKVGDLALRQGRVPDAVTYYERAVEHYATAGLFNNAIALCNKILRNAPGRSNVYFTLGRICARKGLRGDATRNFLEYAARMQQEGRVEEAMRALGEVADLMPELTEVRRLVDEHAERAGVTLPRRRTPQASAAVAAPEAQRFPGDKSSNLVFLEIDYGAANARLTPPLAQTATAPIDAPSAARGRAPTPVSATPLPFLDLDAPPVRVAPLATESVVMTVEPAVSTESAPATSAAPPAPASLDPSALLEVELVDVGEAAATQSPNGFTTNSADSAPLAADDLDFEIAPIEPESTFLDLPMLDLVDSESLLESEPLVLSWDAEQPSLRESEAIDFPVDDLTVDSLAEDAAFGMELVAFDLVDEPDEQSIDESVDASTGSALTAIDGVHESLPATETDANAAQQEAPESQAALPEAPTSESPALMQASEAPTIEPPADDHAHDFAGDLTDDLIDDVAGELTVDRHSSSDAVTEAFEHSDTSEMEALVDSESAPQDHPPVFSPDLEEAPEDSVLADEEVDERNAAAIEQSIRSEIERMEAEFGADEPRSATPIVQSASIDGEAPRQPSFRPLLTPAPMLAIDAAIAAGAERALREAEADPDAVQRRPPYRLDPHDFILPGELPPLLVSDELVDAGIERANTPLSALAVAEAAQASPLAIEAVTEAVAEAVVELTEAPAEALPALPSGQFSATADPAFADPAFADSLPEPLLETELETELEPAPESAPAPSAEISSTDGAEAEFSEIVRDEDATSVESAGLPQALAPLEESADAAVEPSHVVVEAPIAEQVDESVAAPDEVSVDGALDEALDESHDESIDASHDDTLDERSAVSLTPSLPIAAVAAEANVVAVSRRDELRALVAERPQDWALRRRLAEALFEAGQRNAALAELEASLTGFVQSGQIAHAADISEMLVGVSPERVSYHQKRVELAVRLKDEQRLRFAYLDLADTLVRNGEEARAQAVYVRVLEIDPLDDRARAALGSAAPPLPVPTAPEPPAEGFVNLADWLREDDAPVSTRMRMREPTVSGDEDADFASLLRHFKEGVSRSLGDEDFESRYDLGVAYKEMGLLDDAVAEFQKALRSRTHRLPAYEALGQCFVEQGRYQVAATVLSRALHEPGLNDEQRVGVLYLLAYSCDALQRWGEARSYFQRVYATDINFRDVAARLAALEHIAS